MANDSGLMALLEQWFADQLAALTNDGNAVFDTAAVWSHQISAARGGIEGFDRYAPFAFVSYKDGTAAREGGYDLRRILSFSILIGVQSKVDGLARFGSATTPGTSKISELVIALFDGKHPAGGLACDEIYFIDEFEVIDTPKQHAIELIFETSKIMPLS